MKKIISGKELQDKMCEAINLLCGIVKTTLGPKGSNVIIDHSSFSPFITNDGVTIAENIQSDDEVINTILEMAIKTFGAVIYYNGIIFVQGFTKHLLCFNTLSKNNSLFRRTQFFIG